MNINPHIQDAFTSQSRPTQERMLIFMLACKTDLFETDKRMLKIAARWSVLGMVSDEEDFEYLLQKAKEANLKGAI